MRLTLIKPNMGRRDDGPYIDEGRMEPLQIGILAALTPPEVEISFFDDRMEPLNYDHPADLVALTVETFTARRSYEISAEYRKRGVKVVLGGIHPTLFPEEVAEHADAIYIGDAETGWAEVIADAKAGALKPVYRGQAGIPQKGIITRRDLYKGKGYLPLTLMQYSRGCRFACTYCAVSEYFQKQHHVRDVREVVKEIEAQEKSFIFFVDDNILCDKEAAKVLFRELIPLKVRWVSQGSIDMTSDAELMKLMVKSGCLGHVIGFESITPESLREMKKSPNLTENFDLYKEPIAILRDHGLQTWAAFTLGHDGDSIDSIRRTVDFAIDNKFCFAAFNILMPYPRTAFHAKLAAEGRLLYDGKWWLHPDYRFNYASFVPKQMSADELTAVSFEARKRFNSLPSLFSRVWDFKTHLSSLYRFGIYLSYTPLFRKETFKKQGMRFGLHRESPFFKKPSAG